MYAVPAFTHLVLGPTQEGQPPLRGNGHQLPGSGKNIFVNTEYFRL